MEQEEVIFFQFGQANVCLIPWQSKHLVVSKLITLNEFLEHKKKIIKIIEFINFNALYLPYMQLICKTASKNMHSVKSDESTLDDAFNAFNKYFVFLSQQSVYFSDE